MTQKASDEKIPYILVNNVVLDAREIAGVRYANQGVYLVDFIDGQQVYMTLDNINLDIIDRVVKERAEALMKEREVENV